MKHDASNIPVITIDGPGGTGKGTMARWLAQKLGWGLLDSGALYRIVAWAYLSNNYQHTKDFIADMDGLLDMRQVKFEYLPEGVEIISYRGEDISQSLRTEACAQQASILAAEQNVREFLIACQRQFKQLPGLVADGRDMGTVIFPEAVLKVFLTASAEVRAKRRYVQLEKQGVKEDLGYLVKALKERDNRDSSRDFARLQPADDALIIDTSDCSISQVQEKLWHSAAASGVV